jgi:hypothetical protein
MYEDTLYVFEYTRTLMDDETFEIFSFSPHKNETTQTFKTSPTYWFLLYVEKL